LLLIEARMNSQDGGGASLDNQKVYSASRKNKGLTPDSSKIPHYFVV